VVYVISYDLKKPGQNYDELFEAIKAAGSSWWHYLESTWLVDSNLTAEQIFQRLQPKMDTNDSILIIAVTASYSGWLPEKAWEWIRQHLR
jgi:hypothetical protein